MGVVGDGPIMSRAQPVTGSGDVLWKSRQKRSQRRPDALTCSVCRQTINRDELTVVGQSWHNEKLRLDPYLSGPGSRKGYFHAKCVRSPFDASWVNRYTRSGAVLETECQVCGRRVRPPRWLTRRDGTHVYYCSPGCAGGADRLVRQVALAHRACQECGTLFTPRRTDNQFCKPACRQKAYRQRLSSSR
jgi:hypothetical protein